MRLTQFSDYSLRILMTLAMDSGKRFTIAELSKAHRISAHHLTKVVHRLAHNGFIDTTRGQGGGVRLGQSATRTSLGAIVRTTEPDFGLAECFRSNCQCRFAQHCTLQGILSDSLTAFFSVLDRYTLGDLVQDPASLPKLILSSGPPRRSKPRRPARTKRPPAPSRG